MMIMAHKRNVEGLLANARKKRETALVRAKEAIRELLRKKQIVNFNTVAQIAGVSTAWLYRQEALKMRIMQLREQDARRARARRLALARQSGPFRHLHLAPPTKLNKQQNRTYGSGYRAFFLLAIVRLNR
jgi:hypothetical protein